MALQYEVKRGDSLWNLAGRHLGDPGRWPELWDFHNGQADRYGATSSRIFRIKDPNMIFVDQILYLPIRSKKFPSTSNKEKGTKHQAGQNAIPIDRRIEYTFGHGVPPIIYVQEHPEGTIRAEMSGKISIELIAPRRYRHNLELLMAKNELQCRQKLNEAYLPAFSALTAHPDIVLEGNRVILAQQGPAKAELPPYDIPLTTKSSGHLYGKFQDRKSNKSLMVEGNQYKFSHDIEFVVEVDQKKTDKAGGQSVRKHGGFISNLKRDLKGAGNALVDHFGNKENWREIGRAFGDAGKISLIAHGGSVLKAYIIFDVATGGVVTTTTMVAAGTPAGQKIITEFIPSMNPGTLPSLTHYGIAGFLTGTTIETIAKNN